jgi:hypothetical protein
MSTVPRSYILRGAMTHRNAVLVAAPVGLYVLMTACTVNKSATPAVPSDALAGPVEATTAELAADAAAAVALDAAPAVDTSPPLAGADFEAQARAIYYVAACGSDTDPPSIVVPPRIDPKLVDLHCKDLRAKYEEYKTQWMNVAMPYLAALVPKSLPPEIVYPFGGGDLMTALATFPDAPVYTTISLEVAGDVRKIDTISMKKLQDELSLNRVHLGKLFEKVHSRTVNLDLESKSDLPGEIVFSMVGLALYGYEPVSLRYFRFNPDGTLHYLEASDIEAAEKDGAAKKRSPTEIEGGIFSDMELRFRKRGDPKAPLKILRHIAFNLDDKHLRADGSLLKHLDAKGKVTAMTKAASHFLWSDDFSLIRQYLLDHMEWMISDSTGIPPRFANKAGFIQDTFGIMEWPAAFGPVDNRNAEDLRKLWKTNPQKDLPFRYGYPDRDHHGHMMITRRPSAPM